MTTACSSRERVRRRVRGVFFAATFGAASLVTNVAGAQASTPTLDDWVADLHYLRDGIARSHPDFFRRVSHDAFGDSIARVERRLASLSDGERAFEVQRLVALAGDDHSTLAIGFDPRARVHAIPVRFRLFRDGLFVVQAAPEAATLVGRRVVRIGSQSADDALARMTRFVSSQNASWVSARGPETLPYLEALHSAGVNSNTDSVTIVAEDHRGSVSMTLHARTDLPHPRLPAPSNWISAQRTGTSVVSPDGPLWFGLIPRSNVVYARMHVVGNGPSTTFAAWTRALLHFVDSVGPSKVAIDVRDNNGGDNTLLAPLIDGLASRPSINQAGHLFVITGRETSSAAQNFVTRMERKTKATFVGEPTGSAPNHFGDPTRVELPNTHLTIFVSTRRWDDSTPDDTRTTITPRVLASPTFAEWSANIDPALAAILRP